MPARPSPQVIAAVADEIAHHPIGSGYYTTTVSTDEAREIAETVLTFLAERPDLLATLRPDSPAPAAAGQAGAATWTAAPVLAAVTAP